MFGRQGAWFSGGRLCTGRPAYAGGRRARCAAWATTQRRRTAYREWVHSRRWGLGLAVLLAVAQLAGTRVAASHQPGARDLDALAIGLLLVGPAGVIVIGRSPLVPLAGSAAAVLIWFGLGYPVGPVVASLAVSLVVAVLTGHRWVARVIAALSAAGAVAAAVLGSHIQLGHALGVVAWLSVLVVAPDVVRTRREVRAQEAKARAAEAARVAGDERLRIARELHDVLAHSISLINVQAGVALHLMGEHPEQVRAALTAIKAASSEGLRDLRGTISVLRDGGSRAPTAGLADLDRLLAGARSAGLDVQHAVMGSPRPLPPPVDLAAYRVAQEALTNITRHSGATRARLGVAYEDAAVVLTVDDDGPSAPRPGSGHGLLGMRERAAALDGELRAGPRPGGGFSVRLRLPSPAVARL